MRKRRYGIPGLCLVLILAGGVWGLAQTGTETEQVHVTTDGQKVFAWTGTGEGGQAATYRFIASEMGIESKVVKGAPFSADTVTEFSQTLGNGQRIYRKTTSSLYRDSEGRTRREQTIDAIGPFSPDGAERKTIFINDPVAGVSYILDPENGAAIQTGTATVSTPFGTVVHVDKPGSSTGKIGVSVYSTSGTTIATPFGNITTTKKHVSEENIRTESLGVQIIEGVQAEGTRTIETIPTGAIGNDSPIEIVSEKWYSPELDLVVKTSRNDPMSGDNVYQVTNIRRGEPSQDLFRVPPDYPVRKFKSIKKNEER